MLNVLDQDQDLLLGPDLGKTDCKGCQEMTKVGSIRQSIRLKDPKIIPQ